MKSDKQRRQEIKSYQLRRKTQQARFLNARPVDRPIGTVAVTPAGYGPAGRRWPSSAGWRAIISLFLLE
jgi:hypothetical protein